MDREEFEREWKESKQSFEALVIHIKKGGYIIATDYTWYGKDKTFIKFLNDVNNKYLTEVGGVEISEIVDVRTY